MNMFTGEISLRDVFPYPLDLSAERKEMTHVFLQSVEKFMSEVNNPTKFVNLPNYS